MRRKKPPKGGPPPGFGQVSGAPPPGRDRMPGGRRPRPGDPAPAPGALDFRPLAASEQRRAWEAGHIAWLNANGLAWTHEDLAAWYDHPDRDRLPMPGVLEWQKRISQHYGGWPGAEPTYRDTGPALDEVAARQIRELRQAREADAGRLAWLESALAQAAGEISGHAAERAESAERASRQEQAAREHAARQAAEIREHEEALREKDAEIARQANLIRQHESEIRHCQDETARLNAAITGKDADAGRLRAMITDNNTAITRLQGTVRELLDSARRKDAEIRRLRSGPRAPDPGSGHRELLRGFGEQMLSRQAVQIRALEAENTLLTDIGPAPPAQAPGTHLDTRLFTPSDNLSAHGDRR